MKCEGNLIRHCRLLNEGQEALGAGSGPRLTASKKTRTSVLQLPVTKLCQDQQGTGSGPFPKRLQQGSREHSTYVIFSL